MTPLRPLDYAGQGEQLIHPNGSYTAHQVAAIVFKKSYIWFSRHKTKLTRENFPPPISEIGLPRWSGAALLAWMQTPRRKLAGTIVPDMTNVLDLRTARMRQERKKA